MKDVNTCHVSTGKTKANKQGAKIFTRDKHYGPQADAQATVEATWDSVKMEDPTNERGRVDNQLDGRAKSARTWPKFGITE